MCRDAPKREPSAAEDSYWTKGWQKNIGYTPHEINYNKSNQFDEKYSDRFSVGKMSAKSTKSSKSKSSGRESNRY